MSILTPWLILAYMEVKNMYRVFTRNWWKPATTPGWPNNVEPDTSATKSYIAHGVDEHTAREVCRAWNATHEAGKLSRKAEFEEVR